MGIYSDRVCAAAETLEKVTPLLRNYGITRVARVTGLDRVGIPVWNAMRPNARSLSIHQGKGITDDDARASAVMEAIERAVAECVAIPHVVETRYSLTSKRLDHDALDSFVGFRQVPAAGDKPLAWIEGRNLLTGSAILLPLEAVTIDRTRDARYWQSSDGLASGNTLDEALFHGLLERVERDADILWSLERRDARLRSRFDPSDLGDPVVDKLSTMIADAGLRLVLFDKTSDLGIPVVSALIGPVQSRATTFRYIDAAGGCGAHPIAARATIRAITEAAQSRLTLITGARDDVDPSAYENELSPDLVEDLASPAVKPPPPDACHPGAGLPEMASLLFDTLSERVTRLFAVHLTPEENKFSVVKVFVPELENPEGARRQRYGARALAKLTVF
ncbi:YcaO-like family protein (plasmid) [Rhizobium sp. TH2]|uniref:YcaO-like family protein n=1 Tax=Rhizobium sp. TH2 TaxID=2775403 RepID=UPI0021576E58|nr:YcaO-like family protein [Rhizobium sp. TH2]UVC12315.1 YcaO-like family protein [Rhizobium sp. TH2]